MREGCRWALGDGGRPRRLSLKLWRCGAFAFGMWASRKEGLLGAGERDSEKLDRAGAVLVEEEEGDGERESGGGRSVIAEVYLSR